MSTISSTSWSERIGCQTSLHGHLPSSLIYNDWETIMSRQKPYHTYYA